MKDHHHHGHLHPPSSNDRSVIHEAIAVRAYELWQQGGQPADRADENWLEAERELATGRRERPAESGLPISF